MNKILDKIKSHQKKEYLLFGSIPLFVKAKLTNKIDLDQLVNLVQKTLPRPPEDLIKSIVISDDPLFDERQINALFYNNVLHLSNNQDSTMDMLDDIVHEYAHALEEKYGESIYSDDLIKNEFLFKRHRLERIIRHQGFDTISHDFKNINFDKKLDSFLLNVVGYEKFNKLTDYSLFLNPYAATSLREYFATGFEEYILGDSQELATVSPNLYKKIKQLF